MKTKKEEIELGIKCFEDLSIRELMDLLRELKADGNLKNSDYIGLINERIREIYNSIEQIIEKDADQKMLILKITSIGGGVIMLIFFAYLYLTQ